MTEYRLFLTSSAFWFSGTTKILCILYKQVVASFIYVYVFTIHSSVSNRIIFNDSVDSMSYELSHIVLLPFLLCLPRDSVTSHGAGAPLAQQEVVRMEEQRDIALEDTVCLLLETLQVLACTPTPQPALSTSTVCAADHWISHQMCCTSAPAAEERLWCHTAELRGRLRQKAPLQFPGCRNVGAFFSSKAI